MLLRITLLLLCTVLVAQPPLMAGTLEETLAKMDAAAASFQGLSATVTKVAYTAVIDDTTEEIGLMRMQRTRPRDLRMLIEFTQPDEKSVYFEGQKAEIYYPKIKTVHEYDLGKQRSLVEQFLLLGFGTSGKELARQYSLKVLGKEVVAGQSATRLELFPKSNEAREHLEKIELWIADSHGNPVQQKFFQPADDYTLITYKDLKLNPASPGGSLTLELPKGVKREYPQR